MRISLNKISDIFDDQSVISKVERLLVAAIEKRASDIHLEQCENGLVVRFRIDGFLTEQEVCSLEISPCIIGRLKVMAYLNISERRVPQDGKFQMYYQDHCVDFRISTFPCLYGEKVVIRILDQISQVLTLDSIGFSQEILLSFKKLLLKENGFFLVTGPTGSGKTTTLYAALLFLNSSEKNIITLEDPVEYSIKGITQAQVNIPAGFTFQQGMRSLVRQDPDIIMVGEIRDTVTAHIAIEASLTGHLVLSSLHTACSVGAIIRLIDMSIEPFLIAAGVSGVLAQRLIRMLCFSCRKQKAITDYEKTVLSSYGSCTDYVYKSVGCAECDYTGYKGRIGIFEFLEFTNDLKALIVKNPCFETLSRQAKAQGMKTLMQDGASKVQAGTISFEDFIKIIE